MKTDLLLNGLNPQQKEALLYNDGPLMVLAGAGSGKTRVITYKYAYLNKKHRCSPASLFTVTFTNKAANEMRERICSLIGTDLRDCWIGTFHSQCNRILRREIKALGYSPDFVIYDETDQHNLIRHILKDLKIYEALYKGVASRISTLKAQLVSPEEFLSSGDGFGFDEKLAKVYVRYQDELQRCNAVDFDDLIMLTVRLFSENPEILDKYQEMFRYILVDEFQDTNRAQYEFVRLLASRNGNIAVVGDDDQSIYRFRGAEVKNIFRMEDDFPGLKVIKLEQNYRCTKNILHVSSSVIRQNPTRKEKELWTENSDGDKVHFHWLPNEEDEALYVTKTLKDIYLKGVYSYGDMAVLYRINLQSRALEEAMRRARIPYRIVGGISFFERREIKDILSYLRMIINPHDNVSLRRIINTPQRGIGNATLNKIEQVSRKKGLSLYDAIREICREKSSSQTIYERLMGFVELIDGFGSLRNERASEAIKAVVDRSGYAEGLEEERLQNIAELMASGQDEPLTAFLDRTSLYTRLDDYSEGESVTLMTLHSAKGLEFPVVFIVGLEEGLLPYFKSVDNVDELCEERRLLYVGMTRAKNLLCLTGAQKRRVFSKLQDQEPSRFLKDIPKDCCYWIEKTSCLKGRKDREKGNGRTTVFTSHSYKTGCRVRHPKWGIGVVRDCYGEGDEQKVCVNFPGVGLKRLALKFAQLERI